MHRSIAIAVATCLLSLAAAAQVVRNFPAAALRGEIVITVPPEILLNGRPARLSPGARIRGMNNMLEMSGAMVGARLPVHYTFDFGGEVSQVWVLREDELAKRPWPRTVEQAQSWQFDPAAQTWTRP